MNETECVRKFENLFDIYDRIQDYLDLSESLRRYLDQKRSWIDRLKSPEFPVAFLGTFSAGKSMIINAIIGKNILPEATKSYTAIPTIIKKSDTEAVTIRYLDEDARRELRNLYVEEIARELHKSPVPFTRMENQELLTALGKEIEDHVREVNTFHKEKFFDELKNLIAKWDRFKGEVRDIEVSELSRYVTEDYEDVLLVDRVEVRLAEIDIPENVVLVDLPGLGVVNPRHKKITQSYVENDAKAFVISSAVFKLLEGEEIELLAEIHRQRPKVLKRAFWVINKWETASERQKKEEIKNFHEKVERYQFRITPERVFRVSALNYLLLRLIGDNTLDQSGKLREHLDNLKKSIGTVPSPHEAPALIEETAETREFSRLRAQLFDYLNTIAGKEFFDEARTELVELSNKFSEILKPFHDMALKNRNLKDSYLASELTRRLKVFSRELRHMVQERIKDIRTEHLPELVFWTDDIQKKFESEIREVMTGLDRKDLKNELMRGMDTHENQSRLPQKIEERLPVARMFREQLRALMTEDVVHRFSSELLSELKGTDLLPDSVQRVLEDKLSKRDILTRINGLCDVFLFEYGDRLDMLGFEVTDTLENRSPEEGEKIHNIRSYLKSNAEEAVNAARKTELIRSDGNFNDLITLKENDLKKIYMRVRHNGNGASANGSGRIETVLELYEGQVIAYMRDLQEKINDYTRRSIKNYFEELEADLLNLFEEKEPDIAVVIMEQLTATIEDDIGFELRKQRLFTESYQTLCALTL